MADPIDPFFVFFLFLATKPLKYKDLFLQYKSTILETGLHIIETGVLKKSQCNFWFLFI